MRPHLLIAIHTPYKAMGGHFLSYHYNRGTLRPIIPSGE